MFKSIEALKRNWMNKLHQKLINLIYFIIYEFDIVQSIFSFLKYKINK